MCIEVEKCLPRFCLSNATVLSNLTTSGDLKGNNSAPNIAERVNKVQQNQI